MNSLSWMIYAAEALGNLSVFAVIGAIVSIIGIVVGLFVGGMVSIGDTDGTSQKIFSFVRSKWWVPLAFALVAVFSPSSNTIYLIAASEAGETIVTSPEAREVFNDLKTIIKSKLKEQLPKT
jgi:uncharacterized membrane protein required for colicin V production